MLQAQTQHYLPGTLEVIIYTSKDAQEIVQGSQSSPQTTFDELKEKYGITYFELAYPEIPNLQQIYTLKFSDVEHTEELINELRLVKGIKNAEQIPIPVADGAIPPDAGGSNMWYLQRINQGGWDHWKDLQGVGRTIKIAIVDCGVRLGHEDIKDNLYVNEKERDGRPGVDDDNNGYVDDVYGYDVADDDPNANPPLHRVTASFFSHGTKVAGLSSASTDNGVGIASLGLNTKIIPVKCIPNDSLDDKLWYAWDGMRYALNAGADIINCSWSQGYLTDGQELLLNEILERGIVVVASAGNFGNTGEVFPAAYPGVVAVGATTNEDKVWTSSNYGSYIDVMAPGVNIYTTTAASDKSYGFDSGTSFATPIVSGFLGLLLSQNDDVDLVIDIMKRGCRDIDIENPGKEGMMGAGLINIDRTLQILLFETSVNTPQKLTINVYPNPNQGVLHFPEAVQELTIVDLSGRVLVNMPLNGNQADLRDYHLKGLYILQVKTQEGVATARINFQ